MQSPKYTLWVKAYFKKYWYLVVVLILLSLGAVLFVLITPLPLKFLADNVFGSYPAPKILRSYSKDQLLLFAAVAYAALYGLQALYTMLQSLVSRKFNQYIDKVSLYESYHASTTIPYGDESQQDSGTYLYQITNQSQQMSEYILTNFVGIAQSCLMLLGFIIVLAQINLRIMLIAFVVAPLLALCVYYFGRIIEKRANETENAHAKVYSFIEESLSKIRTVQAFVLGRKRQAQLDELVSMRNYNAMRQLFSTQLFDTSVEFIILGGIGLAIYMGGKSVFAGLMTFGDLLIFIAYINSVFGQVSSVIQTIGSMKVQAAALQQAFDTVNASRSKVLQSGKLQSPITGSIEFMDVTIAKKDHLILRDVSCKIPAGSVVAFVGISGSGKTTLFNSILRFVNPDKGWIYIDGHDIREYDIDYLRKNIALIEQEPDLFNESVNYNIGLADELRQFNLIDIMAAATISNSTKFIDKLPSKFDSVVDNRKLSGGQKQRLAVARAFYKKAPIVLMDEPTSALDKEAAHIFIQNVQTYFKGKTVLIISHDLSLLQNIPDIYVVSNANLHAIADYGGLDTYAKQLNSEK